MGEPNIYWSYAATVVAAIISVQVSLLEASKALFLRTSTLAEVQPTLILSATAIILAAKIGDLTQMVSRFLLADLILPICVLFETFIVSRQCCHDFGDGDRII